MTLSTALATGLRPDKPQIPMLPIDRTDDGGRRWLSFAVGHANPYVDGSAYHWGVVGGTTLVLSIAGTLRFYDTDLKLSGLLEFPECTIMPINDLLFCLHGSFLTLLHVQPCVLDSHDMGLEFTRIQSCNDCIVLTGNCSYLQVVQYQRYHLTHSEVLYLDSWPLGVIKFRQSYYYVVDARGSYTVYRLKDTRFVAVTDNIMAGPKRFGYLSYGRVLQIAPVGDNWLVMQEFGWTLYDKLSEVISSQLVSQFEKFIPLNDNKFAIVMANHSIMYVDHSNVRLVDALGTITSLGNDLCEVSIDRNSKLIKARKLQRYSWKEYSTICRYDVQTEIDFGVAQLTGRKLGKYGSFDDLFTVCEIPHGLVVIGERSITIKTTATKSISGHVRKLSVCGSTLIVQKKRSKTYLNLPGLFPVAPTGDGDTIYNGIDRRIKIHCMGEMDIMPFAQAQADPPTKPRAFICPDVTTISDHCTESLLFDIQPLQSNQQFILQRLCKFMTSYEQEIADSAFNTTCQILKEVTKDTDLILETFDFWYTPFDEHSLEATIIVGISCAYEAELELFSSEVSQTLLGNIMGFISTGTTRDRNLMFKLLTVLNYKAFKYRQIDPLDIIRAALRLHYWDYLDSLFNKPYSVVVLISSILDAESLNYMTNALVTIKDKFTLDSLLVFIDSYLSYTSPSGLPWDVLASFKEISISGDQISISTDSLGYYGHYRCDKLHLGLKISPTDQQESSVLAAKIGSAPYGYPPVFKNGKMAALDLKHFAVHVWTLTEVQDDALDVVVVKDDMIPLKVPDFELLFIQKFWNQHNFNGNLMSIVAGHRQTGKVLIADTFPIATILYNYMSVFKFSCDDVGLVWDDNLALTLNGNVIYTWDTSN